MLVRLAIRYLYRSLPKLLSTDQTTEFQLRLPNYLGLHFGKFETTQKSKRFHSMYPHFYNFWFTNQGEIANTCTNLLSFKFVRLTSSITVRLVQFLRNQVKQNIVFNRPTQLFYQLKISFFFILQDQRCSTHLKYLVQSAFGYRTRPVTEWCIFVRELHAIWLPEPFGYRTSKCPLTGCFR